MVVLGKKNDEEESWGGLSKKKKKGKKKGGKTAKSSTLQHAVIRLSAFSEVRVEPPANAADLAACLATLAAKRSKYEAGELEAEAEPEPEPELKVEQPTEFVNDSSSSPSLAQAHGVEPEQDQDVLDFLDGIKEDDEDDEDGAVAGEANGYGTVAVDLAAEMRKVNEMKAKGLNPDGELSATSALTACHSPRAVFAVKETILLAWLRGRRLLLLIRHSLHASAWNEFASARCDEEKPGHWRNGGAIAVQKRDTDICSLCIRIRSYART